MAAFNWRRWIGSKFGRFTGGARKPGAAVRHGLLSVEQLEGRLTPANFVVTNANDSGPGSLRDAIDQANDETANPGLDHIWFDSSMSGKTISLTSGESGGDFASQLL